MKSYTFLDGELLKLIMEQEFAQSESETVIVNKDGQVINHQNDKEEIK